MTTSKTTATNWDRLAKRLDTLTPATTTFTICDDADLRQRLAHAKAAVADAEGTLASLQTADEPNRPMFHKRAEDARDALAAVQAEFDQKAIRLRFKALARQELEALQNAHPASEKEEDAGEDYEMETFAPALISAASADGMPVEYAKHLLDTWSAADARALWHAAWSIQHQSRTDLGKG
ncbi:hypothetical protein [Streptomyces sp. NPDC017529]|uniref:hypothetical protein n=1 Tax=Streptomyces sp. NPDC017529 TaxID=3365000 RepID=UPI0037BDBA0D